MEPQGPRRWRDLGSGELLPPHWHIGLLSPGDTYARGDGVVWTVQAVVPDPHHGGLAVHATRKLSDAEIAARARRLSAAAGSPAGRIRSRGVR